MGILEESGMSIGDFAMSLIDSGQVSKKESPPEVARPKELPVTDVDISEVRVSSSIIDQVLQESFGLDNSSSNSITRSSVLTEQELLQEKIVNLREELVETINKLTSLVAEMAGMGMSTTRSIGTGYSSTNIMGKHRGRNKHTRTIKRISK